MRIIKVLFFGAVIHLSMHAMFFSKQGAHFSTKSHFISSKNVGAAVAGIIAAYAMKEKKSKETSHMKPNQSNAHQKDSTLCAWAVAQSLG